MPVARSLQELLHVRDANRGLIAALSPNLGTAVGFKTVKQKVTGEPAVVFFVAGKLPAAALPPSQCIPKVLFGPGGLSCPTDVVVGHEAALPRSGVGGAVQAGRRNGGRSEGRFFHADPARFRLGAAGTCSEYGSQADYLEGVDDEEDAYFAVDSAFAKLFEEAVAAVRAGVHWLGAIGSPLPLRLAGMGLLGRKVVRVGRSRRVQHGNIAAFAYEWCDENDSLGADYLICGADGRVLSDNGDDGDLGNLVVTDDARRNAVALLWGGCFRKLRHGIGQEAWDYAIDIHKVLEWRIGPTVAPSTVPWAEPKMVPRTVAPSWRRGAEFVGANGRGGVHGALVQAFGGGACANALPARR